ncbi:hypothetical protein RUM44_005253 [Polyplax serrata]|uniref:VIR protein n=1 Tax=Polyplax serrata TaxID=468196 RepID=A0ABR1AEH6_POLSC
MNFQQVNCMQHQNQQWYNNYHHQTFPIDNFGSKFKETKFDDYYCYPYDGVNYTNEGSVEEGKEVIAQHADKFKQYYPCMLNPGNITGASQKDRYSTVMERNLYSNEQNNVKIPENFLDECYKPRKTEDVVKMLKSDDLQPKSDFIYDSVVQNNYKNDCERIQKITESDTGYCESQFPLNSDVSQNSCEGSLPEVQKTPGVVSSLPIYPWMAGGIGRVFTFSKYFTRSTQ